MLDLEVSDIIHNLKNSSSKGEDNIPVSIVKFCCSELCQVLAFLINESLSEGIFPDALKVAIRLFQFLKLVTLNMSLTTDLSLYYRLFQKFMKRLCTVD